MHAECATLRRATPDLSAYLGSEVHDRVNLLGLQHEPDQVCTLDITLDELQGARW